jgi:hypothetical protein
MSNGALAKVTAKTAAEVCKHFSLGDEAKKLLRDGLTPRQFLDLLVQKEQFPDAARFLAHALPKREAAERWAADPSEDNRRKAQAAAEAAEMSTPAGCAAMAAFWSGGSLAPPNVPAVPPGEFLTAHGVAGAVMLAAVLTEPQKAPEKYRKFFALGVEVGNGTNKWK